MEKNPETSEKDQESSSENGREKMKVWLQENLRMLVSIIIVVVIAGGIYAYSKRAQAPAVNDGATVIQDSSEGKISVIGGDTAKDGSTDQTANTTTPSDTATQPSADNTQKATTPQPASQETGSSFVQTASKGDGTTTLARRSLANYLEKNPDASLTAEHKVYIEDFLRRQVKDGRLKVGDTREFSKDTIANAIEKSKGLSSKQLKNLQKYSKRVSGLN